MTSRPEPAPAAPPSAESGEAAPFAPLADAPPAARRTHSIPALDGVRAIAASMVFLVHFQAAFGHLLGSPASPAGRTGRYLADVGYNGVNVFFLLSGYLIYGSLIGRPTPFRKFFVRRVRRIYPTYWVVLTLYLLVGLELTQWSKLPRDGAGLYLVQNALLIPGVFPIRPIVTVSWSLSYEIFFYLGLALAVAVLALRRWAPWARTTMLVAAMAAWIAAGPAPRVVVGSFIMFLPGMLLYEALQRWPVQWRPSAVSDGLIAAAVALALAGAPLIGRGGPVVRLGEQRFLSVSSQTAEFVVLAAGAALLTGAAVATRGLFAEALSRRGVRTIGLVSYSFYLIHGATINVVALLFTVLAGGTRPAAWWYVALIVPVYTACVGTSLLLFRAVERRFSF